MKLISCLGMLIRNPLIRFVGLIGMLLLASAGRSIAQTDYLYYSGSIDDLTDQYYRYDTIGNEWDYDADLDGNWTLNDAPDDPGCLVGGDNFSTTEVYGYTYAQDTVTGDWYYYGGNAAEPGGDAWVRWEDPNFDSTDFTYGWDGSWTIDDALGGSWYYSYDNTTPYDESQWVPWDNGAYYNSQPGFYSLGEIIGGQNWDYDIVSGYAYDSINDTWYIDDDYQDDPNNDEIWSVTSSPL